MGHKGRRNNNRRNNNHSSSNNNQTNSQYPKLSQEQLQVECLQIYQLLCNKTKILKQQKLDYCYIISTKWLEDWKQYVGFYNLQQNDQKKHKKVGKKHPGKINHQLVSDAKNFYQVPLDQYDYLNTVINQKKQKDDDFIAIAKQIWDIFASKYDHVQIKRPKKISKKGSILYDGAMLQLQVVIANFNDKQIIQKIQAMKQMPKRDLDEQFSCDKMQLSTLWKVKDLQNFLTNYCQAIFQQTKIKIWKVQGFATVGQVQRSLWQGINKKQQKILVPCRQITQQKYKDLDLDEFLKDYYCLVLQIGKGKIQTAKVPDPLEGYCQQCVKKKILNVYCICQQMFYCSQECRVVDQVWHQSVCQRAFDSQDDEDYAKKIVDFSKIQNFQCGLANLGNTCYMNSALQALLSVHEFSNYFLSNKFVKELDPKQQQQNKGRLVTKFSKFLKQITQKKQSISPWSLKGQVNYFLPPFKGFKQHDANDFLVNFINTLNQQLKKEQGKVYHKLFQQNFLGEFVSLIKCPDCTIQISNDEIFTQITLPIKQRTKTQTTNYVIYENSKRIIRGKCEIENSWDQMRKNLGLSNTCLLMAARQGQHAIDVQQEDNVEKTIKKLKRQLIYYPNCNYMQNDEFFSFLPITQKNMYGQRMKAPYNYPSIISLDPQLHTLGSFWVQILKEFASNQVYEQAIKIKECYFKEVQEVVKKYNSKQQNSQQTNQSQIIKQNNNKQENLTKQIQQKCNKKLQQLLQKNKINVLVNDIKRNRNICAFCKKKCNGCQLPVKFSQELKQFLQGKNRQVNFQIILPQKVQQQKIQKDTAKSGEPTLHDCMQLFTQPEQLDEQNAWWCQSCENLRLAYKQLTIKKLPKILIIHLNRFKTEGQKKVKNSQPIQYQQYQLFCGKKYQLLSVIVHQGSTQGGHYWAICKRNQKYYIFNDNKVSVTQKICNKNAYIVIYRQVQ